MGSSAQQFSRLLNFVSTDIELREGTGRAAHAPIEHGLSVEYFPSRRDLLLRYGHSLVGTTATWKVPREFVSPWKLSRLVVLAHKYMEERLQAREELHRHLAACQLVARYVQLEESDARTFVIHMERELLEYGGPAAYNEQEVLLQTLGFGATPQRARYGRFRGPQFSVVNVRPNHTVADDLSTDNVISPNQYLHRSATGLESLVHINHAHPGRIPLTCETGKK